MLLLATLIFLLPVTLLLETCLLATILLARLLATLRVTAGLL